MARPISPDHDAKKNRILRHATKAFAMHGYHNTPIDEIASKCGISKALIHYYFKTKHDLLFEGMLVYVSELESIMRGVDETDLSNEEKVADLTHKLLRVYQNAKYNHVVLVNELKTLKVPQRREIIAKQDYLVHTVGRLLTAQNPHLAGAPQMRPVIAMLYFGMINWTYTWYDSGGAVSPDELANLVIDIMQAGIKHVTAH